MEVEHPKPKLNKCRWGKSSARYLNEMRDRSSQKFGQGLATRETNDSVQQRGGSIGQEEIALLCPPAHRNRRGSVHTTHGTLRDWCFCSMTQPGDCCSLLPAYPIVFLNCKSYKQTYIISFIDTSKPNFKWKSSTKPKRSKGNLQIPEWDAWQKPKGLATDLPLLKQEWWFSATKRWINPTGRKLMLVRQPNKTDELASVHPRHGTLHDWCFLSMTQPGEVIGIPSQ